MILQLMMNDEVKVMNAADDEKQLQQPQPPPQHDDQVLKGKACEPNDAPVLK